MTNSEDIARLLRDPLFRRSGETFDRGPLIKHANRIGPQMRLLHWQRLEQLGLIPDFDSLETEDAISGVDRFGAATVEIFMVSHRWLRPSLDLKSSHPDDERFTKARALIDFSIWRRNWVRSQHGFLPEIFYWIDYSCFDPRNAADSILMLPLWVACCERLLCFEVGDYHDRAWCRLELLLAYAFGFADHQTVIGPGFRSDAPSNGREEVHTLERPTAGGLTVPGDAISIQQLERLACQFAPSTIDRVTAEQLGQAQFGVTVVRRYRL